MLAAILNGKRRGTGLAGKNLTLGKTEGAEDVLTATVFERIAYLPDLVFNSFLSTLLDIDQTIGSLEEIIFWPSWSLYGRRIEPDVVLRGSERTLLVEAKRDDDGLQQDPEQLARELDAGLEEDMLGENPIILTVGGMLDYSESTSCVLYDQVKAKLSPGFPDFKLFCRSWYQVFQALSFSISKADADGINGLHRLADDIAEVYEWHGLRTAPYRPLEDMKSVGIDTIQFPINIFRIKTVLTYKTESRRLSRPLMELESPGISHSTFPFHTWSFH
ncbi:MAG: hypothetical protein ACXWE9_09915 [Methylobacter sp.]